MSLDAFLATIIIVSFLITIVMAVGSYGAYKLRERRRPIPEASGPDADRALFVRIHASELNDPDPRSSARP